MSVTVQIVPKPIQRRGKNPVRALNAFPLLSADFP